MVRVSKPAGEIQIRKVSQQCLVSLTETLYTNCYKGAFKSRKIHFLFTEWLDAVKGYYFMRGVAEKEHARGIRMFQTLLLLWPQAFVNPNMR